MTATPVRFVVMGGAHDAWFDAVYLATYQIIRDDEDNRRPASHYSPNGIFSKGKLSVGKLGMEDAVYRAIVEEIA
jgi:hypothetical protein